MIIELDKVSVGYENVIVLHDIDLVFESGKIYCILGSNGIGKTTLFKTMLGMIPLKSGIITVGKEKIEKISPKQLAEYIAYVPQAKDNSYDMSVLDVVVMGRARFIKKFAQPSVNDYNKAEEVLKKLKIEKLIKKKYSELSGGEQQIVLIARALVQESKFIIMDEPASNLDFENQRKVLECLVQLAEQGIGIILSSHSPDHAIFCDSRVVMIDKDKNIYSGLLTQVLTDDNLKKVYGVNIQLISTVTKEGKIIKTSCLVNDL